MLLSIGPKVANGIRASNDSGIKRSNFVIPSLVLLDSDSAYACLWTTSEQDILL